jgi:hypothetical protein
MRWTLLTPVTAIQSPSRIQSRSYSSARVNSAGMALTKAANCGSASIVRERCTSTIPIIMFSRGNGPTRGDSGRARASSSRLCPVERMNRGFTTFRTAVNNVTTSWSDR